jgi:hypothetical protein
MFLLYNSARELKKVAKVAKFLTLLPYLLTLQSLDFTGFFLKGSKSSRFYINKLENKK